MTNLTALSLAVLLLLLLLLASIRSTDSLTIEPGKKYSHTQRGSISNVIPECSTSTTTPLSTSTTTTATTNMRRRYIQTFLLSVLTLGPAPTLATTGTGSRAITSDRVPATGSTRTIKQGETITVPLTYIPSLSGYVVYYSVGGDTFGAILDTGSPFLTVPSFCDRNRYGCYLPEHSQPSSLSPTWLQFDNNGGVVEWRKAPFSFVNATGSLGVTPASGALMTTTSSSSSMTFGVLPNSLMGGSGGTFLGLVRDTDSRTRPSFLGQTDVQAFEIDLASSSKTLTLTTDSLLDQSDYIPLVRDLNRQYGDATVHYTAKAKSLVANNCTVGRNGKPIYVIFDTGVSGMVVSRELLDERYATARNNRERSLWGSVQLSFQTKRGQTVELTATKPLTTPLGLVPWPGSHLIVVGLAFLDDNKMTVDIDKQKLWIE